jgi:hypothetical protein
MPLRDRLRVLIYTCAGGHDALTPLNGKTRFLSTAIRQQLLMRGLSFNPEAVIANGDHVYWNLEAPRAAKILGASAEAIAYAGKFDSKLPVLGTANEKFLKRAAGKQIAPLYATLCRSIPVFFVQDDHDYFDNDEADDTVITFPPRHWMLNLARATQSMYFPEFLPDLNRPPGLPGCSAPDRPNGVISGDLHAIGEVRIVRTGSISLEKNPVVAVLAGPKGTGDIGWPSAFRGIGPLPSRVLDVEEALKPIEENGFTLVDFTRDGITLRYFRWKTGRDTIGSIASLESFRTTELKRPG